MDLIEFKKSVMGSFNVFYATGVPGATLKLRVPKAYPRNKAFNVLLVVKGSMSCAGPGKYGAQDFTEGMLDEECPEFTHAGEYTQTAGVNGIEFFCISHVSRGKAFNKEVIDLKAKQTYLLAKGGMAAISMGKLAAKNKVVEAPIIVTAFEEDVIITAKSKLRGVALWT